jgi:hypothetical protein
MAGRFAMRAGMLALLWTTLCGVPLQAADEFPYTAYVNGDDVYVRSGPGQNYYPTSKMQLGQEVEVYRHDPGGWYAVRPPEGSFCWVAARYLKLGRDNIAVITGDRVVARVGSEFSDIRDVIQVRLDRGEEVEVLETKNLDIAEGGEKWAKVAPVAGEFRWVLGKFLDRMPPEPTLLAQPGRRNRLVDDKTMAQFRASGRSDVGASLEDDQSDRGIEQDEHTSVASNSPFRPVRRVSAEQPVDGEPTGEEVTAERSASYDEPQPEEPAKLERLPLADVTSRPSIEGNTVNEDAFQAELDAIELEVSRMVVEEPTVWSFTELKTRAEITLARAQTALERGRARLVLGKIERFEQIRDRYQTVAVAQADTDRLNGMTANDGAASSAMPRDTSTRFDGSGRLIAVVSPRIGAPQFALTDETGNVRTYVTAAPGVGLRPYLGRQVGISGTRGYIPEYKARHLTAKRVLLLEQPRGMVTPAQSLIR